MLISKSAIVQHCLTLVQSCVLANWVCTSIWLLVIVIVAVSAAADFVGAGAFGGLVHVQGLVHVLRSVDGLA